MEQIPVAARLRRVGDNVTAAEAIWPPLYFIILALHSDFKGSQVIRNAGTIQMYTFKSRRQLQSVATY